MPNILLDLTGDVASIILNNLPGNRINFAMRRELLDAIAQIESSAARVAIVRGAGEDFCRGGDVREWVGRPSSELRPKIAIFADALERIRQLPIPTIAVVQGACRGGGFELALSCDFIVAGETATFAFPEARSGILTLQGGVMMLAQRIGHAKALELTLLGDAVSADQMRRWNVVNDVVADGTLEESAQAFARRLANGSPAVSRATKLLLRTWAERGESAAMAEWYDASMPLFDTDEAQAGLCWAASAIDGER